MVIYRRLNKSNEASRSYIAQETQPKESPRVVIRGACSVDIWSLYSSADLHGFSLFHALSVRLDFPLCRYPEDEVCEVKSKSGHFVLRVLLFVFPHIVSIWESKLHPRLRIPRDC